MVTIKNQTPSKSQIIDLLAQTIANPVNVKSSDFMMGLIVDHNGNSQENLKQMINGEKYYYIAFDECVSKTSDGLPDYSKLPLYIVPFELKKFTDKNVDTFFTWVRAGMNAVSTLLDIGIFAQDQAEALVIGQVNYNDKIIVNPKMYLASYLKGNQIAFLMTISEN